MYFPREAEEKNLEYDKIYAVYAFWREMEIIYYTTDLSYPFIIQLVKLLPS